jgi:hypothetical protein
LDAASSAPTCVTPREFGAVEATARGKLPFGFRRQLLAGRPDHV